VATGQTAPWYDANKSCGISSKKPQTALGKAVFLRKQLGAVRLASDFAKKRLECDVFDEA